jgi:hypothetical protein
VVGVHRKTQPPRQAAPATPPLEGNEWQGRHPLAFEQLLTVESHENHLTLVDYLKKSSFCQVT